MCYNAGCHFYWACPRSCNNEIISRRCMDELIMYCNFYVYKKQKQVSIEISKRNLADVGMVQWMHQLTKYTNKVCYTLHNIATLFNNHLYISSSKFSADWRATATYVGYVGCWIMWECYGVFSIPCLCTLLASAFIEPSLHQLDFFLEIFLWRL